jgi:MSHA pilin protein MshC
MSRNSKIAIVGFTTIELVTVLLITGIVAVAAVARFSSKNTFIARFFPDQVRDSIRYAQKYAVGTGCWVQVVPTASNITLLASGTCTSSAGALCSTAFATTVPVIDPQNPSANNFVRTVPANSGITISNFGQWPIYFNGLGQAFQCSTGTSGTNATPYTISVGGTSISVIGVTGFTQ